MRCHLYENEYQSMFWMLYEASTKRFIVAGDAFPIIYKVGLSFIKRGFRVRYLNKVNLIK